MSVKENKAIVRELMEGWQDPNVLDKLIDANIVLHPGDSTGLDAYKQGCANNLAGFPDMHITIEDMVAEGDRVAAHYTQTGTHTGEWAGFAPTGKPTSVAGALFFRIAGGKIVEQWNHWNPRWILSQLGLTPTWEELVEQAKTKQD